jgi:hypothetical protein
MFSRLFSVPIAYYGGNSTIRWITFCKIKGKKEEEKEKP